MKARLIKRGEIKLPLKQRRPAKIAPASALPAVAEWVREKQEATAASKPRAAFAALFGSGSTTSRSN